MTTILLIDDDVDLMEMNKIVLENAGYDILVAYTAREARDVLKQKVPDIAVVDVMMETDTAGFELAREVHEQYPSLPMIMLSGIHKEKHLSFRFEPDDTWLPIIKFMDKPINPVNLASEIKAILAEK
ncbi:MAG: response regulator [Phycisphaerae bacterium]|nr:response regulator [Phycisphaerae bacterium]